MVQVSIILIKYSVWGTFILNTKMSCVEFKKNSLSAGNLLQNIPCTNRGVKINTSDVIFILGMLLNINAADVVSFNSPVFAV